MHANSILNSFIGTCKKSVKELQGFKLKELQGFKLSKLKPSEIPGHGPGFKTGDAENDQDVTLIHFIIHERYIYTNK